MIQIYERRFLTMTFLAVLLGMVMYAKPAKALQNETKSQAHVSEVSTAFASAAFAPKWQEGTACVANNAPTDKCAAENRGKCRTGRANGCSHDDCTTAKGNARANLRNVTPAGCHAYIQSTSRCQNGPGC